MFSLTWESNTKLSYSLQTLSFQLPLHRGFYSYYWIRRREKSIIFQVPLNRHVPVRIKRMLQAAAQSIFGETIYQPDSFPRHSSSWDVTSVNLQRWLHLHTLESMAFKMVNRFFSHVGACLQCCRGLTLWNEFKWKDQFLTYKIQRVENEHHH